MDTGAPLQFDAVPVPPPPGGPLAVELVPAPDPWAVAKKLAHLPHLLFLDSAEKHDERGRYSYVAADPSRWDSLRLDDIARCNGNPVFGIGRREPRSPSIAHLPPFQGGDAFLIGYGANRGLERIPRSHHDEFECPDSAEGTYEWVVCFDHQTNRAWVVARGKSDRIVSTQRMRSRRRQEEILRREIEEYAEKRIARVLAWLRSPALDLDFTPSASPELCPQYPLVRFPSVTSNFDRAGYEAAVRRAVEYIHAGDCFQVNLSQRLLAPLREHPLELYGRLRQLNPAPFAAYFDLGDFQILSASPERFLRVYPGGEVETRPIKGTRPRGYTPEHDASLSNDLATSAKDRAENVMIVDLLRNDIGKVCEYGSVRVPRVCEVETFRYVHHLVSEVRGKLKPGLGPLDLLAAAFPGGSVTGAPKVRAMEIIAELEPTARGPYCGCLGWIGFDGAMDTNILIRTFTAGRGWVQFPVGGGVVADSDPAREYEETLHKAAGLLRSLEKH
jgi:para-aminobenzoate synthetase component 1